MALTFPASPTNGQIYDQYVYNATSQTWRVYGSDTGIANVLATKSNLSGGNTFTGIQLTPSQPAFYANGASVYYTSTNMGDVPFSNAFLNIGSCFNTSTYRFTAPVAGVYQINTSLFYISGGGRMSIKVNGGNKYDSETLFDTEWSWSGTIYLAANDYVTVGDWQSTSGGQMYMGHSSFSGFLVG